jgi:hypothetical protein
MLSLRLATAALLVLVAASACSSKPAATTAPPAASAKATAARAAGGPAVTPPANASLPPGVTAADEPADTDPWSLNATAYDGQNATRYAYWCPPGGAFRTVWGTDLYTHDSSVCTAGVHAGAISQATGGFVVIEMRPGADSYTGSDRNGVTTQDYGQWGTSYVIVKF